MRHHPDSAVAGLLLFGWLSSRLGWQPGTFVQQNGSLHGRAATRRQEVALCLEPEPRQAAPGLAGLAIETASGDEALARPRAGRPVGHARHR